MLEETLKKIGFSDKEILIYQEILKKGRILPAEVAKITGLNRSTVYSVASELKKKGVITEDLAGPVAYLVALPPEDLGQIIAQEQRTLEQKKKLVDVAVDELQTLVSSAVYQPPKITFITQEEIRDYLYKRTPAWNESLQKYKEKWWGFQDHTFVDKYGDWIDWYWTEAAPKDMELKLLSNKSETEKKMKNKLYERRMINFWNETKLFNATIWINGDYIIMINTSQEPHYLMEINDPVFAHNLREVFKGIWKTLERKK